jgi:alpha-L-rhamnosidase
MAMKNEFKTVGLGMLAAALVLLSTGMWAVAAMEVDHLQVDCGVTPLGTDNKVPEFGWQMKAGAGERDVSQSAYQVVVKDAKGAVVWDSGKVAEGKAAGIAYVGVPLQAATRYTWTVKVWDQAGAMATGSSWFETGLMNPDPGLAAWDGATWIGGGNEDLVLYAPYLSLFNLKYNVAIAEGSTRAGFVLGANDSRLMDKNKNIYQLENGRNQSYIKVELDIADVEATEGWTAKLKVYRAGYAANDVATRPMTTLEIGAQVINRANKNRAHTIAVQGNLGQISVTVDGSAGAAVGGRGGGGGIGGRGGAGGSSVTVNPLGSGGDVVTYGLLCDIGFAMDAGQKAAFSKVEVSHVRNPGNVVFAEDLTRAVYDGIFKAAATDENSGLSVNQGAYMVTGGTKGALITADPSRNAMPMLRTTFAPAANKRIAAARLYVTARGIYEMYLNGKHVGEDYYNPGLTQYDLTHLYQTYDVTSMVTSGQNGLGAMLGEGWWSGLLSFGNIWNHFSDRQSLLAKLVITYDDGTRDVITTNDRDWKYFNKGPVLYSSLDMGEAYDATREAAVKDWSTAAYDDRAWKRAVKVPLEGTTFAGGVGGGLNFAKMSLMGQIGGNAGVFKTLTAKSVKEVRPGVFVYNMGQNMVGVPRITIASGKAGGRITLRVSEMLYPDLTASGRNVGMLMTENYRAALSQDVYIMKDGPQVFQPHFTSHGYQYIEITGIDQPLPLEAVQGLAMSSVRALTADYATSNPQVNQLWSNLVWSNVDNFLTIPTDCPQRNERMGWSGDISMFARTATYLSNSNQFLKRHLLALRNTQSAQGKFSDIAPIGGGFGGLLWGSAGITVAWENYQQFGDVATLAEHYDAMAAYINYLEGTTNRETGISSDSQLGDWLGPQNNQLASSYLTTVYHIFDLDIMAKTAEVLGKKEDAAKYKKMHDDLKATFNRTFVNAEHKVQTPAGGRAGRGGAAAGAGGFQVADTQTAYAVGLALNAFSDENVPFMVQNLRAAVERENRDDGNMMRPKYSLMTGFIGTAWISKALSDGGASDLAYRQLQNSQYPSWLYAVDQGATSIWERLNGYTIENGFGGNNGMNSFNHYSFGAVGQWMMAYSLGIQRDEPGFRKFILQPEPDPTGQMTWARGYYDSLYGRIASSWKVENGVLTYAATVPANTTTTLYLPTSSEKSVKEGGKPVDQAKGVTFIKNEKGKAVYTLKSGSYEFVGPL